MFSKITAQPSFRHATTANDLSANRNSPINEVSISNVKTKALSAGTLQAIQKIADGSIQNKEKMENLVRRIHLAELQMHALKEEHSLQGHGNANGNSLKPILRETIVSLIDAEKTVRDQLSGLSKEIQLFEKKQQQLDDAAAKREAQFKKHFSEYKTLLKEKNDLEACQSVLNEQHLSLREDITKKNKNINSLERQLKSIDESIKKAFNEKISGIYEETMQASALFKQAGMQSISGVTMEKLTEFLRKATDQSKLTLEQKKNIDEKRRKQDIFINAGMIIVCTAAAVIDMFMTNTLPAISKNADKLSKQTSLQEQKNSGESSESVNGMNVIHHLFKVFFIMFAYQLSARLIQAQSLEDEAVNLGKDNPLRRILKQNFVDPAKSKEEELFKFAFGLARHGNMKLFKSPMETMATEVIRLVTAARNGGDTSINIEAVDKGKINDYLNRIKDILKEERARLGEKLDVEIKNFIDQQIRPEIGRHINESSNLSAKANFVNQYMTSSEANTARAIADKAIFIDEYIQIFNGGNADDLADAIRNMIVNMSQKIIDHLSSADAGSIESAPSFFERRITDAEKKKQALEPSLQQANIELTQIAQENKKIEDDIQHVIQRIQAKKSDMATSEKAMTQIPLKQEQLAVYEPDLSAVGIHIDPPREYAGLTAKKIDHAKIQQREADEKLAGLLKEHGKLHKEYAILQNRRKQNEDQIEKIELLEKTNKADKDKQIKNIEDDVKKHQKEIERLAAEESTLVASLEKIAPLREILTEKAIKGAASRHLEQSDIALMNHALIKGYSSNYRSVGHFLQACLDTHASLQHEIEASGVPELKSYFAKSDMDIADGMNRKFQTMPISASVSDFFVKVSNQGERQYLIDHIYGYVPREPRTTKYPG